jgi:hypothetical protein
VTEVTRLPLNMKVAAAVVLAIAMILGWLILRGLRWGMARYFDVRRPEPRGFDVMPANESSPNDHKS